MKHDSKKYLENSSKEMDDALIKACLKGSPQALQLYYKVQGRLVDKTEVTEKKEISADEHMRIMNEADKRINEIMTTPEKEVKVPDNIQKEIEDVNWGDGEV